MSSTDFQFVAVSVDGRRDAASRRAVRAHAARNINVRRQRVAQYLSRKQAEAHEVVTPARKPSRLSQTKENPSRTGVQQTWHMQALARQATTPDSPRILGVDTPDPFNSFHRTLAPFEELFLDYFFRHVVANDFSELPCADPGDNDPGVTALNHDTGVVWTQAALADPGMLASIFLVACRSLSRSQNGNGWDRFALRYKIEALQDVQKSIAREGSSISEITITKTLALASEEFFSGNPNVANSHLRAVVQMVRLRKKAHTLAMWRHANNRFLWLHSEEAADEGRSRVLHYYHDPSYCVNPNPDPRVVHVQANAELASA